MGNKENLRPCISVVVPVYNVENYVKECLQSVVDSDIQYPVECIIVDDCSSDHSMDIVRNFIAKYEGPIVFKLIAHERNQGIAVVRNTGIKNADGEYLYYLDSDDSISSDCLRKLYDKVIEHPKVDLVVGGMGVMSKQIITDSKLAKFCKRNYIGGGNCRLRDLYITISKSSCNRLIRLDYIQRENMYFLPQILCEDLHWFLKSYFTISSLAVVQDITYFYRNHRIGSNMYRLKSDSTLYRKTIETIMVDLFSMNMIFDAPIKFFLLKKALAYKYNVIKENGSENPNHLLDVMTDSGKFSFVEKTFIKFFKAVNYNKIADAYLCTDGFLRLRDYIENVFARKLKEASIYEK